MKVEPDLNWRSIPAHTMIEIYERVNSKLVEEHIPKVPYDVFSWRMARGIQYRTGEFRSICSLY
jgi:hypothetical protein